MNCQFSEPVNLEIPPKYDWEFSKIECLELEPAGTPPTTTEEIYDLVINPDFPERNFFVEKTFSYGDALIVFFLTLFFVFFVAKGVFNFFWKK